MVLLSFERMESDSSCVKNENRECESGSNPPVGEGVSDAVQRSDEHHLDPIAFQYEDYRIQ